MNSLAGHAATLHRLFNKTRALDFLAPLALRLYLAPIMISAGYTKATSFADTAAWFGNPDWGLGLPFPTVLAFLATATELAGGVLLLLGLFTRYVSVPLMVTMLVAIFTVHWPNGWFAIAPSNAQTSTAVVLDWVGLPGASESLENSRQVGERLDKARSLLREHGHYDWLTGKGPLVVLNNGIEFAVTYFIMLLVLFFQGAGRYLSLDYWIARRLVPADS
ncbi:DoxX family protein [Alcanivorax hongdengensis A-11-3]|uniref:DoxX family protein n=1 Tax=Alcanivorax hongdengensis A-11-3 TaxID=1177179 RepID=L0W7S3_9GAMM|nr:DoxX family protein [Alcanivorax hongdengensis]EKF72999.1 DoxX family protein [Alcanivorax hongdengensis A-11-3]